MKTNQRKLFLLCLAIAVLFALLFFHKKPGLNLLIFEWITIPFMFYLARPVKWNYLSVTIFSSTILSSILVVFLHTQWSIFINILLMILLAGIFIYQKHKSFIHLTISSVIRMFTSQTALYQNTSAETEEKSSFFILGKKIFFWGVIPVLLCILFIIIYTTASSSFYQKFEGIFNALNHFFAQFDFLFILYLILGWLIANVLLIKTESSFILVNELTSSDLLTRKKKTFISVNSVSFSKLKLKYWSGVIVFSLLNLLILFFNITDISTLWIHYQWDGSFLKEFVHEGTWLLVFSIFLSAGIVLFFFKGQLNFYSKNRLLKTLTFIWIGQNIVMTISVYFALSK